MFASIIIALLSPTLLSRVSVIPSQRRGKGEPAMAFLMAVVSDKIITA